LFTKLAAEPSPLSEDLWLCVPASRQVCPYSADYEVAIGLAIADLKKIEQTATRICLR
jgi:hypothetical protein